jgi:site-specific DNA-cytosine methylase
LLSWATPKAEEHQQRNSGDPYASLSAQVKDWPTPQAHDVHQGKAERVDRFGTKAGARNLTDDVMLWPTGQPDLENHSSAGSRRGWYCQLLYSQWGIAHGRALRRAWERRSKSGKRRRLTVRLNPTWVEALMNYPMGWTAGVPDRERLKMLGNAVVPAVVEAVEDAALVAALMEV